MSVLSRSREGDTYIWNNMNRAISRLHYSRGVGETFLWGINWIMRVKYLLVPTVPVRPDRNAESMCETNVLLDLGRGFLRKARC